MLEAIIGGIVGAFSAFLFNVIQWRMNLVDSRIQNLAAMCIDNVDKLEGCCRQYWSFDFSNDKNTKKSLEIEIKVRALQNNKFILELMTRISDQHKASEIHRINNLCGKIFDTSTGGDFESSDLKVDIIRANRISRMCYEERFSILQAVLNTNKKYYFF